MSPGGWAFHNSILRPCIRNRRLERQLGRERRRSQAACHSLVDLPAPAALCAAVYRGFPDRRTRNDPVRGDEFCACLPGQGVLERRLREEESGGALEGSDSRRGAVYAARNRRLRFQLLPKLGGP